MVPVEMFECLVDLRGDQVHPSHFTDRVTDAPESDLTKASELVNDRAQNTMSPGL